MNFISYINIALKEKECDEKMLEVIKLLRKCFKKIKPTEVTSKDATIFSLVSPDSNNKKIEVIVSWVYSHKLYKGYDRTIIISTTKEKNSNRTYDKIEIDADRIQQDEFLVTLTKIKHYFDKLVTSLI